jgi:hypothetical protein
LQANCTVNLRLGGFRVAKKASYVAY